jgi:predicted ATP-dependent serine protease
MVYGKGGVGKSTWIAWVAAKETRRGGLFGFVSAGEETNEVFAAKVKACGGDVGNLRFFRHESPLRFPKSAKTLAASIQAMDLTCVYFDALRSHMDAIKGANEADRSRLSLQPLAEIAAATGCAVLATTHTTKYSDEMLGSDEVKNIARAVLYVQKPDTDSGHIIVKLRKSNFLAPIGTIVFRLESTELRDAVTNAVQYQKREDGTLEPVRIGYVAECLSNAMLMDELEDPTVQPARVQEQQDVDYDNPAPRRSRRRAELFP